MPLVIHAPDGDPQKWWAQGGVWDRVLSAHPGLELTIAHGFSIANQDTGRDLPHVGSEAAACDETVGAMVALFDEHDGGPGKAMLRVDMVGKFTKWWVAHNDMYQQGLISSYDYKDLLKTYKRHLMIGSDPILNAARVYQSDGCGANAPLLEQRYLNVRMRFEGPYWPNNPQVRYMDLAKPAYVEIPDAIYRESLFETVAASAAQAGPAGRDANGVRRIDCAKASLLFDELIASVRTADRGTTPQSDPLLLFLEREKQAFVARCAI